jgi:hypothetical protein
MTADLRGASVQTSSVSPLSLWCPFQASLHPHAAEITKVSADWLVSHGLERTVDAATGSTAYGLGPHVFPRAEHQHAQLSSDFIEWLFVFDDTYCDEGRIGIDPTSLAPHIGSLAAILDEPTTFASRGHPIQDALRDLRLRMEESSSQPHLAWWIAETRTYLFAMLWEAGCRQAQSLPPFEEYRLLRRYTGAVPACLTFVDQCRGFELSHSELHHPDVKTILGLTTDLVDIDNDLDSYAKEVAAETFPINGVIALRQNGGAAAADAIRELVRRRDEILRTFLEVATRISESMHEPAVSFLEGLQDWLSGHITWNHQSSRFTPPTAH